MCSSNQPRQISPKIAETLSLSHNISFSKISVPNSEPLPQVENLVGKMIKPYSLRVQMIMTHPKSAYNLLKAFKSKKIDGVGYGFVMSGYSALFGEFLGEGEDWGCCSNDIIS